MCVCAGRGGESASESRCARARARDRERERGGEMGTFVIKTLIKMEPEHLSQSMRGTSCARFCQTHFTHPDHFGTRKAEQRMGSGHP